MSASTTATGGMFPVALWAKTAVAPVTWTLNPLKETPLGFLNVVERVTSSAVASTRRKQGQADRLPFCVGAIKFFDGRSRVVDVVVCDDSGAFRTTSTVVLNAHARKWSNIGEKALFIADVLSRSGDLRLTEELYLQVFFRQIVVKVIDT
jgi:hypothetical protein